MPIAVMANKVDAQVRRNREGVGGWGEQDPPPPYFGRSVNPISNKEADYVQHITKGQLILKAHCQAVDSPKKRTNGICLY